jgi:hypothetical protein
LEADKKCKKQRIFGRFCALFASFLTRFDLLCVRQAGSSEGLI